ncbi:MAG: glycosyltransferase family A protein [Pseudomonadota bacterium]
MSDALTATVVVPVWNDPEGLEVTLAALAAQSLPQDSFEVLVVDNGSAEAISAHGRAANVRVLSEKRPGSYCARNRAVGEARGRYLAFTDAQCAPDPDWLTAAIEALERHAGPAFLGGQIAIRGKDPKRMTPVEIIETVMCFNQRASIHFLRCAATANLIVPRALMARVGAFDEYFSGGDYLWCKRAGEAGVAALYEPRAIVTHPSRGSEEAVLARERRIVAGHRDLSPGLWPTLGYAVRRALPPTRLILYVLQLPADRVSAAARWRAILFLFRARYDAVRTRLMLELNDGPSVR